MKKVLLALAMVALFTSCDRKSELESIYDEMAAAKDEKKQDPNFKYFNDKHQINQRGEW